MAVGIYSAYFAAFALAVNTNISPSVDKAAKEGSGTASISVSSIEMPTRAVPPALMLNVHRASATEMLRVSSVERRARASVRKFR